MKKYKDEGSTILETLKSILLVSNLKTQDDIKQALELKGYRVNQSKISRLLHKVGAVKITNENKEIIYSLPREPAPSATKDILTHLIMSITYNELLIVIRTNPGSASLIARLLDHNDLSLNILGTVAGDDTIFIAPKSIKHIAKTWEAVKSFLGEGACDVLQ